MNESSSAADSALAVMHAHLDALNARDADTLAATLHFPHYRLVGSTMKVWPDADDYLSDFFARAGGDWAYTRWNRLEVLSSNVDKVHIRAEIHRFRKDDSLITHFESMWVITRIEGRWAAQLRSSFANR